MIAKKIRLIPLLFILLLASTAIYAQTPPTAGPAIRVEPPTMDLGSIPISKVDPSHTKVRFAIYNDGNKPLILQKVSGCCGTDIKDYTKGPILPGKEGEILVEFRTEPKLQAINRTVTILSNATNTPELAAQIVGKVVKDVEPGRLPL